MVHIELDGELETPARSVGVQGAKAGHEAHGIFESVFSLPLVSPRFGVRPIRQEWFRVRIGEAPQHKSA